MTEHDHDISIIVPVLNDCSALRRLLQNLACEPRDAFEVIVVDADENSGCNIVCDEFGARRVVCAPGRGHQLNVGTENARGSILWFVHADAEPPPGCVDMIRNAVHGDCVGGHFRFRFTGERTWYKNLLQRLINWRTKFGTPYGDQGLFVARDAFAMAGGFAETPLFEEVPLVRALRKVGNFRAIDADIGVSCRRWERDGWLRRSLANRALALAYASGIAPEVLARRYRPVAADDGNELGC